MVDGNVTAVLDESGNWATGGVRCSGPVRVSRVHSIRCSHRRHPSHYGGAVGISAHSQIALVNLTTDL